MEYIPNQKTNSRTEPIENHEEGEYENNIHDLTIKKELINEIEAIKQSGKAKSEEYEKEYLQSICPTGKYEFYQNQIKRLTWKSVPSKVIDESNPPFYKWFPDGEVNACYNCVDRHINDGYEESIALIGYSSYTKNKIYIKYKELKDEVVKLAKLLKINNVNKGDTVIIYMPMIVEAIFASLACARIGAVHSIVFGGFASDELSDRIVDAKPKLIITASVGVEPRKNIPYYPIIVEALSKAKDKLGGEFIVKPSIVLLQRTDIYIEKCISDDYNTIDYRESLVNIVLTEKDYDCEYVMSNHPLYILYTSGTTGIPKGIVRDTGGYLVMLDYTMEKVMNLNRNDVFFSTSDIGWVVGHNYIIYGPLLRGATSIIYEGKPNLPHIGIVWELIQEHKVKVLYTAPTAIRAIRKDDTYGDAVRKYDISSLISVVLAGERCDPESVKWMKSALGEKVLINDNYWQTETGYPLCCNNIGIYSFPVLAGSTNRAFIGQDIVIYDLDNRKEINESYKLGYVYVRLPLSPGFMLTLWNNDQFFIDKYITKGNKYYITGDAGYIDENKYFHIMTRLDDIINVAGHRLSTGRMEEVLLKVDGVCEAAVVSIHDELKLEVPFAFVSVQSDLSESERRRVVSQCKDRIVTCIGAISRLKDCVIVNKLPKTRSGKILRSTLKHILNREKYRFPSTIEDASVLEEIEEVVNKLIW